MTVNTNKYFLVHGKKPRGYALWMFEINGIAYSFSGMYSEAKKQVLALEEANHFEIYLLP